MRKETDKWWHRYYSVVYPQQQKHRGERNTENENSENEKSREKEEK